MPTPSGGGGSYRKIKFTYTYGEEERELDIYAEVVTTSFQLTSTALADFIGPSSASTYAGYHWQSIGDNKKIYCKNAGGNDGRSYLTPSMYYTTTPQTPEVPDILLDFSRWQVELESKLDSGGKNILKMSLNPDEQFHTPDETGTVPKIRQGKTIETAEGVSAKLTFYQATEYVGDEPVTKTYNSGLWAVKPSGGIGALVPCDSIGTYNSEFVPSIGFWVIDILHDNATIDGDQYGEHEEILFIMTNTYGTAPTTNRYQSTMLSLNVFYNEAVEGDPTPQDPEGTVTPGGWVSTGGWDYTSDSDDVRSVTGHDFVNRWKHGVRLYYISDTDGENFMNALWSTNILTKLKEKSEELFGSNVDYIKGVICLHKLPFGVSTDGTSALSIMGTNLASKYPGLSAFRKVKGNYGSVQQISSDPLNVPYQYGKYTFMDWNHSSAFVRLPFVGNVPIPIKYIRQGSIKVNYNVDILTGNCVAQVFTQNYYGTQILYYQGSGNCAIPIPFSGNSQGGFKQLGTMVGLAGAYASGGLTGVAGQAMRMMQGSPSNTASYSYVQSETSDLMDLTVKLIVTGDIPLMPENQQSLIGYSAACSGSVSTFLDSGITYGKIRPDTIYNATAAEKDEIKALFEGGVIL